MNDFFCDFYKLLSAIFVISVAYGPVLALKIKHLANRNYLRLAIYFLASMLHHSCPID